MINFFLLSLSVIKIVVYCDAVYFYDNTFNIQNVFLLQKKAWTGALIYLRLV